MFHTVILWHYYILSNTYFSEGGLGQCLFRLIVVFRFLVAYPS